MYPDHQLKLERVPQLIYPHLDELLQDILLDGSYHRFTRLGFALGIIPDFRPRSSDRRLCTFTGSSTLSAQTPKVGELTLRAEYP